MRLTTQGVVTVDRMTSAYNGRGGLENCTTLSSNLSNKPSRFSGTFIPL